MKDIIVRATAADAQIRAFSAYTRELTEQMRQIHETSPVATAAMGRLLTGAAMMGVMLKGEKDLLTIQVKGDGPIGQMTVTADALGRVKGYVQEPVVVLPANSLGKLDVGGAVGAGYLRVIKDMGMKEPYVGQTALQTGEIGDDLTFYFATSEQVPSCVGLGVLMEKDNTVKQAGGFIIQLMPFAEESVISRLEENLSSVGSVTALLEEGKTPEEILAILLEGLEPKVTDTVDTCYYCSCSRERVHKAVISIGKKEIMEMIEEGKDIEINCHFCGKHYVFTVNELSETLDRMEQG